MSIEDRLKKLEQARAEADAPPSPGIFLSLVMRGYIHGDPVARAQADEMERDWPEPSQSSMFELGRMIIAGRKVSP